MKRALIVDDSRLARAVLSRVLTEHGVVADTAESAEVALEYLKHSRPDVVFLDHMMPGLDGFEALEAIKTNPATATIPVMMYTSQEGELYVGQARALGALGVLPKTMKTVDVVQVLRSLRLIPDQPSAAPAGNVAAAAPDAPVAPAVPATAPPALDGAQRLRELLEELFYRQSAALRDEMRRELHRLVPPAPPEPSPVEQRGSWPTARVFGIASGLLLVACGVFAYLYFATNAALDSANQRIQQVAASSAEVTSAVAAAISPTESAPDRTTDTLAVLEWGVNQGGRYQFGTVPLDDDRAVVFTALFEQLDRLGFAGTVAIDVHVGRFCMNYGANGMLELARPDQPAAVCEQVGWPDLEAVTLGQRQTPAFANAVATASARNPRLVVETTSYGSRDPVVPYPFVDYDLTAKGWNAVAAANNRVDVHFVASGTRDNAATRAGGVATTSTDR